MKSIRKNCSTLRWQWSSKVLIVAFSLTFAGLVTPPSAHAQPASRIVRPRMLIGEHDPLTGLNILRARHAAGARPSDGIDGWALTYLLTRDESFAKKAVEEMRRTHPPELVGSRTYPEYVKWSLAFDWLYNYPGFDAQLKDRVALELLKAAEKMMEDQSLKEVQLAMYHNYPVRYLTLAIFALTAIEGQPSVESRAAPLRARAQEVFDHILDLTNFITPDGGYHESMDYQRITYAPLALLAELRRTVGNNDPARRYTVFHHYTDTYLYKVLPDGTTARDDDNEFPYLQWEDNICFGYAINRFKDPFAAWLLRQSGWPSRKDWRIPITQFLWDDPEVTPRNRLTQTMPRFPATTSFAELETSSCATASAPIRPGLSLIQVHTWLSTAISIRTISRFITKVIWRPKVAPTTPILRVRTT